ncbi:MAG: hypothetical protein PHW76_01470 [Alphaproteobacteria bacterium]|nr:hypothetical protein [Alphaproteobacteria bacterium]
MPESSLIQEKIKEALIAMGNNKHDALKLLITWTIRDHALLLAMTKPHLKAIASGHIDSYLRNRGEGKTLEPFGADSISPHAIDDIISSSRSDRRGRGETVPPPKSSERQASAMRRLAAAFTKKKK